MDTCYSFKVLGEEEASERRVAEDRATKGVLLIKQRAGLKKKKAVFCFQMEKQEKAE